MLADWTLCKKRQTDGVGGREPGNNQHPMQLFYQTFAVLPLSSPCSYSATLARTRYRMKQPKKSQNFNNRSGIRSFVWASNPGVHLPVALAVQCCWWRRTSALLPSFPPCSLTPKPPQPTEIATSFLWLVKPYLRSTVQREQQEKTAQRISALSIYNRPSSGFRLSRFSLN
jgi:hypothetical protein